MAFFTPKFNPFYTGKHIFFKKEQISLIGPICLIHHDSPDVFHPAYPCIIPVNALPRELQK